MASADGGTVSNAYPVSRGWVLLLVRRTNIQCTFRPFVFGVFALNFFYWEAPVVLESALVGPSPG